MEILSKALEKSIWPCLRNVVRGKVIWISIHLTLSQSCAPGPERISSSRAAVAAAVAASEVAAQSCLKSSRWQLPQYHSCPKRKVRWQLPQNSLLPKKQQMTAAPISFLPKKQSQMAAAQWTEDRSCLDRSYAAALEAAVCGNCQRGRTVQKEATGGWSTNMAM